MTIEERFQKFHQSNPQVYREICLLAEQAMGAHRKRISMKMLFEVIRWNHMIRTDAKDFKLNNNYHSRYTRLIMQDNPELGRMFEIRELHA